MRTSRGLADLGHAGEAQDRAAARQAVEHRGITRHEQCKSVVVQVLVLVERDDPGQQ